MALSTMAARSIMGCNNQLAGRIVVKTDGGVGCRADAEKEVVFIGAAFFGDGLVESNDPSKPWCYHESRDSLVQMAKDLAGLARTLRLFLDFL